MQGTFYLASFCVVIFYRFCLFQVVLFLIQNEDILEYKKPLLLVLEDIFEKQMKQKETNEVKHFLVNISFTGIL